ncbi:prepilin-type N-terminal cleavage/methylation domain-containing protein [Candidatus Sumerlaeota bacterium]|nr:prepilin-type N-terminal cleavage/methylation domain-containing protein [Candidatus Sumerlaeota bacterium]
MDNQRKGFTLIELLIVVAIIAILAAIAVPNFLEAQMRSKVSRVKADHRTLATAIESYTVDHNKPPYDGYRGPVHWGWMTSLAQLTTPVSYITSVFPDVFQAKDFNYTVIMPGTTCFVDHPIDNVLSYDYATFYWYDKSPTARELWNEKFGTSLWKLASPGPDRCYECPGSWYGDKERYDPTNGTVSGGDIVRTAEFTE